MSWIEHPAKGSGFPVSKPDWSKEQISLPFVEDGQWPAKAPVPDLKQVEEWMDRLKRLREELVETHYQKERLKGLVMDVAKLAGLRVKFVEDEVSEANGPNPQPKAN